MKFYVVRSFVLFLLCCAALLALGTFCGGCGFGFHNPKTGETFITTLWKDIRVIGAYMLPDGTPVRFEVTSSVNAEQFGQILGSAVREAERETQRETLRTERERVERERVELERSAREALKGEGGTVK